MRLVVVCSCVMFLRLSNGQNVGYCCYTPVFRTVVHMYVDGEGKLVVTTVKHVFL